MTDEKQQELKNLLVSTDFKVENYDKLSMQELIVLKNSAATTRAKNLQVEKTALFFGKREEFFQFAILRRLQKMETMYVIFARVTNLPYVYCDPDTCNDQVWLFSDETLAKVAAGAEQKNHRQLGIIKLENKQFLSFYMNLYSMGVNELLIDRGANTIALPLEKLVKKPDYSQMPVEKQPIMNPELLLTAIYFAQDRALPEESRDMQHLHELEEEMLVNLDRGRLLMPVQVPEGSEQVQTKDLKMPIVKLENGDAYQPICTDAAELQKFNRGKTFRAIPINAEKLKSYLNKDTKGVILNPASVRLIIPREKLG